MRNRGIEILRQEERQLTDEEVKNVYIHLQDEVRPWSYDFSCKTLTFSLNLIEN